MFLWNRNKEKTKQEAGEVKAIAPNNKLYFWLLLVAIALTCLSLLIQRYETFFTIWTSITCGGIASIVVAWLIDVANCRQWTQRSLKNREVLLANLYHIFDNGLQLLIFESAKKEHCTESKKWYELIETANQYAMNDPAQIPDYIRILMVFFDDLAGQVFAVKNQEATLLESKIICQEDIQALSTILNICETARATYQSKDSDYNCFQQYSTNCRLIRRLIGYAPSLRPINEMMIEPMIYCMYLEEQEETYTSEASPSPSHFESETGRGKERDKRTEN